MLGLIEFINESKYDKVYFIACCADKNEGIDRADKIYNSPLFKKCLKYAEDKNPKNIHILSAKYNLINRSTKIEKYNLTLNNMDDEEIKSWSDKCLSQIKDKYDINKTRFYFLCGENYYKFLIKELPYYTLLFDKAETNGINGIGYILSRLDKKINK